MRYIPITNVTVKFWLPTSFLAPYKFISKKSQLLLLLVIYGKPKWYSCLWQPVCTPYSSILATFWPHFPPVTSLTKAYIYYARNLNFEDRPDYAWCRWQFIMILMREAGGAARLKRFFFSNKWRYPSSWMVQWWKIHENPMKYGVGGNPVLANLHIGSSWMVAYIIYIQYILYTIYCKMDR